MALNAKDGRATFTLVRETPISQNQSYAVPRSISTFVATMNDFRRAALPETFADDALANDVQCEFRGEGCNQKLS